jgi:hypothetical protein
MTYLSRHAGFGVDLIVDPLGFLIQLITALWY